MARVIGYLAVTGCQVGLLINFGARSLQWRRILPPKNITEHRVKRQWLFVPDWLKKEDGAVNGLRKRINGCITGLSVNPFPPSADSHPFPGETQCPNLTS